MANEQIGKQLEKQNMVMTERELAEKLGLSAWTVRRARLQEGLVHFTVGSRIFYRYEAVLAWISAKEVRSAPNSQTLETGKIRQID